MPLARPFAAFLTLLVLLAAAPGVAEAKSLDQYRAEGVIAERYDGYLEVRDSGAPAEARQIVNQVNAKRKALYEERANEQNVPVSAVGKVYAKQIMQKAPSGTYFLKPDGGYMRK